MTKFGQITYNQQRNFSELFDNPFSKYLIFKNISNMQWLFWIIYQNQKGVRDQLLVHIFCMTFPWKCSLFNTLSTEKASMSYLFSFSRYQTKCVRKFLFSMYQQLVVLILCAFHQEALGDTETYNDLLIILISPTHRETEDSQNLRESCENLLYSLWLSQCVILRLPKILVHQTERSGYTKNKGMILVHI